MLFDYIDTKEIIKSNVGYLTPGNAPYYWIIIALELLLFKSAHELTDGIWYMTFLLGAFVIMLCVAFALRELCDTDEITQRSQVRMTRIVGIVVPLLSLVVNMNRLKLDPSFFAMAVIATFAQIFMFMFLVEDRDLTKGKSLNIPQILVICSSLLFMTHATMASLSARNFLNSLPSELIFEYQDSAVKDTKRWKKAHFELDRRARQILDDESPMFFGLYKLIAESGYHGVHRAYIDLATRQSTNVKQLLTLVLSLWLVTLIRTGQQVKSLQT